MLHKEFEPVPHLKDAIKCFWYESRDLSKDQYSFEVLPDGYAEIIFHYGNLSLIADDGSLQPMPSPFLIGLLNNPVRFSTNGHFQIIGIRCFPWTVFNLLGLSPDKYGVQTFSNPVASLHPQLKKIVADNRIDDAVTLLQQHFLDHKQHIPTGNLLLKAGDAINKSNGTLPVSEVAQAANATVRTLERKFRESSGYTIKDVSGLIRFEQVRNQLLLNPDSNIAGLAHKFGYTDQSHLSKEFKRYSGKTPAAFARNVKRA